MPQKTQHEKTEAERGQVESDLRGRSNSSINKLVLKT
jgi:hypothetical protein